MRFQSLSLVCFPFILASCDVPQHVENSSLAAPLNTRPDRPNIVIIYTDDQGYADVKSYGADYPTPNLDQMASEGARFTSFYVAQPVCSASRAALLTGAYPNRVGVHGAFMPNTGQGLALSEMTLAEMLKQVGYTTGHFGKWHLGDDPKFMPNNQGFDEFFGIPHSNDMWPHHPLQGSVFHFDDLLLYHNRDVVEVLNDQSQLTQQLTAKSIEFIQENKDKPFFLYLAHPQPHVPLFVSDDFNGATGKGLYADVISELDWSVGEILTTIKQLNLDQNTIVMFASDNGPWLAYGNHAGSAKPLREGKATVFEGGVRVPFIVRWPGHIPADTLIDTPVMNIDILPTLAELVDAPLPPNKIDGVDVWPILSGQSRQNPHEAYYFYFGQNELQAIRFQNWKLILPHAYKTLGTNKAGHDGLPGEYKMKKIIEPQLFNLKQDPEERVNVALEHPKVVAKILALAQAMRSDLGDSLKDEQGNGRRPIGLVDP